MFVSLFIVFLCNLNKIVFIKTFLLNISDNWSFHGKWYSISKCYLYFLSIIRKSTMWSLVWMARWSEPTEPIKTWVAIKLTCDECMWIVSGWICAINASTFLFRVCRYLLAFPRTSGQAVCQRDRVAGWSSGRSVHNPEWCKFQYSKALYMSLFCSV